MNSGVFDFPDDIISKAMMFAISAHSGQLRKDGVTPAILHAMECATIMATLTSDSEEISAALLHDTIEDADISFEQIETLFGKRVCGLVKSETEDKHREMTASDSWMMRKVDSLNELKESKDIAVKKLWLSDKLSNMRSFYRAYREVGDELWQGFNQKDKSKHKWYYESISEYTKELSRTAAYEEYNCLLSKIFG